MVPTPTCIFTVENQCDALGSQHAAAGFRELCCRENFEDLMQHGLSIAFGISASGPQAECQLDQHRSGRFHRLLEAFAAETGCPVLINTSFNVRGEPIVCAPEEAYRCFMATGIDVLVLGNYVLEKAAQPGAREHPGDSYLARFPLD